MRLARIATGSEGSFKARPAPWTTRTDSPQQPTSSSILRRCPCRTAAHWPVTGGLYGHPVDSPGRPPAAAVLAEQPRGGAVAIIQRFGGALNLSHARWKGLDLHAGLVIPAGQRDRLERVCRDVLRPPVASERLTLTADGHVRLALRQPWADGTTHVVFDPVEFLGRLAVLVPRPRVNLILSYGVLGARAAWRPEVVPRPASRHDPTSDPVDAGCATATPDSARSRARGQCWAALMKRTFGFDVLDCPRCGGRLRLIALIEEAAAIGRILRHLSLPPDLPVARPARAPPLFTATGDAPAPDYYESNP